MMKFRTSKCEHDWKKISVGGLAYGVAIRVGASRCRKCNKLRLPGTSKSDAKRAVRDAKHEAKREALMFAGAAIQAREGRTAKQRKAARELLE